MLGNMCRNQIYLLSTEEYQKYQEKIPHIGCWWWLRSPGENPYYVASVSTGGLVYCPGRYTIFNCNAVRPALRYSNLESQIIKSKKSNCFIWNEVRWVILDEEAEIAISEMPIAFDKFDDNSNDYSTSHIRKWLLDWYEDARKA